MISIVSSERLNGLILFQAIDEYLNIIYNDTNMAKYKYYSEYL